MKWSTQIGFRLLFWLADALIGDAIADDKRNELRAIATSFNVDSKFGRST